MSEILVLLVEHDGNDSPAVALARNRAELLEQVKVAVWGEPHPKDTTNDFGDDMAEGMTDTLLETGVMTFEGDPPLRLVRIPVEWGKSMPRDPTPEMMAHWRIGRVVPAYVGSQEKADAAAVKRWQEFYDAISTAGVKGSSNG